MPLPRSASTRVIKPASGRLFLLDVPYMHRLTAQKAGAVWDASLKMWAYRGDKVPKLLLPYRPPLYSLESLIEARQNRLQRGATVADGTLVPRAHQQEAARLIGRAWRMKRKGFLLADDVGVGKSASAWKGLLDIPDLHTILIVCPLAVCAHWRNTIQRMGNGGKEIAVINYDRLQKLFLIPDDGKKRRLVGKAKDGQAMTFDAILWDEFHRLKNSDSARAKFSVKLGKKSKFMLWLSATAGETPLDLAPLAPLLAQSVHAKPSELEDFPAWCMEQGLGVAREAFGRYAWSGTAEDIEKVYHMLFGGDVPLGVRRTPQDIAGWPEMNRILLPIDLEAEKADLYMGAWREFRGALGLEKKGHRNPKDALAARTRFRQKSSLLRVEGTVDHILDLLENGRQVAVSVAFQETIAAMLEALGSKISVAQIHGRLDAAEKERQRLLFQRGEARVCIFTVEDGISLHEGEYNTVPRAQILHDLRWSAIQTAQIEGRTHRDGKFSQMYWTYAPGTIDEQIAQVMLRRVRTMKGMIGDSTTAIEEIERLLMGEADYEE